MPGTLEHPQVFLDGQAALEEEERKEEKAGKEFRRFNHRHAPQITGLQSCCLYECSRILMVYGHPHHMRSLIDCMTHVDADQGSSSHVKYACSVPHLGLQC